MATMRRRKIRRNAEGERLYVEAASSHNSCITYIGTGLDCDMDKTSLRSRLDVADAARTKLTSGASNMDHQTDKSGRGEGGRLKLAPEPRRNVLRICLAISLPASWANY